MTVISAFRHRVTVLEPVTSTTGAGGEEADWQPVAEVWGQVKAVSGAERVYADAFEGEVSHKVVLRQPVDVSIRSRLVVEGTSYDIVAVYDPDGQGRILTCECVSRSR